MFILSLLSVLIVFILIAVTFLYVWFQYKFMYWSQKGVTGPKPTFPFGNLKDVVQRKAQLFQPYNDSYVQFKHLPYVGMYSFNKPVLSINDLDLARHILIKNFDHFQSHGIFHGGEGDPLAGHLFNMYGEPWKRLRSKMSPTFSSGKLKNMYPPVQKIGEETLNYVDLQFLSKEAINFTELYAKYVMEIIGSVGFGVEFKGVKDENSDFFKYGHEYFVPQTLYWTFVRALAFFAPDFFEKLKILRISEDMINFFYNLVSSTVEYREKHSYKRNDYLQTLIELKNGKVTDFEGNVISTNDFPFSMNDVAANTMLYMFAGYETSATIGQFAAYELALNPHIQAKAREEIYKVLAKHGGQLTYDAQNEMVYINMILDETMRMYPPMRALFRRCTKDYKVPNSDLVIEKGTQVFIPNHAIQMDPDLFPDPEKFDPERFSPENKAKLHPCSWMPFGEGPRKCLGLRQGYIQAKVALVKILQKYELHVDDRTSVPVKMKASSVACAAEGDIWIRLKNFHG